jgi:hypothetical protein
VTLLENSIIGFIQLVVSIVLAVVALYAGFFALNRITKDVDAFSELARGNAAIGIFAASVFIGISVTVISCIQGILVGLNKIFADGVLNLNDTLDVVSAIMELIFGVLLAIGSIYLAIYVFSRLNDKIDVINAMKKGNVAVASVVAGMIFAVSVIIHFGVLGIVTALF